MGQYYRSIILKDCFEGEKQPVKCSLMPHEFNNGAKLTEFSYINNTFVNATMMLIGLNNGSPFVMCGDYADAKYCPNELGRYRNCYEIAQQEKLDVSKDELVKLAKERNICPCYRYIINEDKKEYVDLNDYLDIDSNSHWVFHPLPLLCADGNGAGGGDFWGKNQNKVGYWKYDHISVSNIAPDEKMGYEKILIVFDEN